MERLATRRIPSSGEELPVIGLGTWQSFDVGDAERERAPLRAVLRALVDGGASMIDSSPMYGHSEEVVGDLVEELAIRPRVFVATKVWTRGERRGREQIAESFRKLRVGRIDLLQVHNLVDVDVHLATLRELQAAGRVRYVGVTHYTASAHAEVEAVLRRERVDFLQINYSVAEREAERRLLPLARDRGVAVIANRPLLIGALLRRVGRAALPAWAREHGYTTWAQLLLAFVAAHPAITCAIPATSDPAHLRDDLATAALPLPDERLRARIVEAIDAIA